MRIVSDGFSTKHLIHQTPFTSNNFFTRDFLHQLFHQRPFTPNIFFTRDFLHQLFHQRPFTPNSFFTRDLLHQLFIRDLLHQTFFHQRPFTPNGFCQTYSKPTFFWQQTAFTTHTCEFQNTTKPPPPPSPPPTTPQQQNINIHRTPRTMKEMIS